MGDPFEKVMGDLLERERWENELFVRESEREESLSELTGCQDQALGSR